MISMAYGAFGKTATGNPSQSELRRTSADQAAPLSISLEHPVDADRLSTLEPAAGTNRRRLELFGRSSV